MAGVHTPSLDSCRVGNISPPGATRANLTICFSGHWQPLTKWSTEPSIMCHKPDIYYHGRENRSAQMFLSWTQLREKKCLTKPIFMGMNEISPTHLNLDL